MVCCINEAVANKEGFNNTSIEADKGSSEDMSDPNDGDLKLKRFAGGSIVDYPPLFSPDEEILFILCGNNVQVFSTTTGELVRQLEGACEDIIGLQYDLANKKYLFGCTKSGKIIKWKWKSGTLESQVQVARPGINCIHTFHLLHISSDSSHAVLTYSTNVSTKWVVVDITSGEVLNCPLKIDLSSEPVFVTVENKKFHYFAVAQGAVMYVINYKKWTVQRWLNAKKVPFTCIQAHPTEELVATGDSLGRIFLWRQLWAAKNKQPNTSLYHWHHTPVASVAFTSAGSGFFSGGQEAVLVKWNIERPDLKDFLPRMSALILHISISEENRKVAVCTADNGVHILVANNKQQCVLQNFTCVYDDRTGLNKFPVGLQLNPRTNCLVLNGRVGYLQFFSTYTRSLLYNMDIVMQNRLSPEAQKILYDIRVTHAAFNVDWMVTGEVWDDQEHIPELRLKFWEYQKENQSYCLNTNVEMPHEGGFNAIEFSNRQQVENLVCATVGKDNIVKMWALGESDNIYKKGRMWFCIGQVNYKSMPIESINFSQDGSLLAAGFGNNLCIYTSENLQMKSILTAPASLDGSLQKVQICMPKKSPRTQKNDLKEKRQKILQLFKELVENNNNDLIKQINKNKGKVVKKSYGAFKSPNLTTKQEEILFRKIQSTTELNLFEKLSLYQKLEIFCTVPKESQHKLLNYINSTIFGRKSMESDLFKSVKDVCKKHRFKAKYKLQKYSSRKRHYCSQINNQLITLMDLLSIKECGHKNKVDNGNGRCNGFADLDNSSSSNTETSRKDILPPLQNVSHIKSIHFARGEFAHLVVICTEHRVLVWNLLTLRLQCVLKLSVERIAVDSITSLFAAFTKNRELYIFSPNAPMVIYRRTNLPVVYGACWVPRRYPKMQSLSIDWQSISTLFFLTEKQELMFLASENDPDIITSVPSLLGEPEETLQFSTFGAFAIKQVKEKTKVANNSMLSIGVPGKAAAKKIIDMSTHAMAPANLLCSDFIRSFMNVGEEEKVQSKKQSVPILLDENDSDDDLSNVSKKRDLRKLLEKNTGTPGTNVSSLMKQEKELHRILKEKVMLKFE